MVKIDPEILAHLEWLGFIRPTGLVVSAPALVRAGAILDRRDAEGQRLLRACVQERLFTGESPRILFLHYWGRGMAGNLAGVLKRALDLTAWDGKGTST